MIKLLLMVAITGLAAVGGLVYAAFLPVLVYHAFAVLRPQFLWADSLTAVGPDFPWSMLLALSAIGGTFVYRMGMLLTPAHQRPPLPPLTFGHFVFGGFAVWITLTYINAEFPELAADTYDEYRKIFIMFFVSALAIVRLRQVWVTYIVATAMLMYIAWEINEIYLTSGGYNYLYKRGYCGLDNNGAALLLALGVPMCIYAWDGLRHWVRWVFPIGAVLIAHCVLLSYSRGAMLSLLVTAPLYIFRARNKKAILAGYLAAAVLVPFMASDQIVKRFSSIGEHESDGSANSRKTTWKIAAKMAMERPLLGFGVRNSRKYTYAYGADEEGRAIHSTYLQIAADSGLVGLGWYMAVFGCGVMYANRARRLVMPYLPRPGEADNPEARHAYATACGVEGALAVFAFGCIFLSLETFEPFYLMVLLGLQLFAVVRTSPPALPAVNVEEAA